MGVTGDLPSLLPPPQRVYSSRYKDAQTQTSSRDRSSYRRINEQLTVEESSSGWTFSPGSGIDPRSWRSSRPPTQMVQRPSALTRLGSMYGTPDYQTSGNRDWEADFAAFRMSWHDERSLFDASSCCHLEDGKKTKDPDIVDWDGPNDPENPLNWTNGTKWANIVTFSTITMIRQKPLNPCPGFTRFHSIDH